MSCSSGPLARRRTAASMSPPTASRDRWTRCIWSKVSRWVRSTPAPNVSPTPRRSARRTMRATSVHGRVGSWSIGGAHRPDSAQTRCDARSSHRRVVTSRVSPTSSTIPRPVMVASRTSADHSRVARRKVAAHEPVADRVENAVLTSAHAVGAGDHDEVIGRRRCRRPPRGRGRPSRSDGQVGSGDSSPSSVHTTASFSATTRSAHGPSRPTSTNAGAAQGASVGDGERPRVSGRQHDRQLPSVS